MVVRELVNLNADSTHPNPWKPQNNWEQHLPFYNPYKIYKGNPTEIKPLHNPLSQDPFWSTVGLAAYRGFIIGKLVFPNRSFIQFQLCYSTVTASDYQMNH